jgi:hypothetical protein
MTDVNDFSLSMMTGSFAVIYSTNLVATGTPGTCPTSLQTLIHDWTWIAKYSHTPLLGRGWQQFPTQYSFAVLEEAHNVKGLP